MSSKSHGNQETYNEKEVLYIMFEDQIDEAPTITAKYLLLQ